MKIYCSKTAKQLPKEIPENRNDHYIKIEELKNYDVETVYNILHFKYLGKRNIIKNFIKRIQKFPQIDRKKYREYPI